MTDTENRIAEFMASQDIDRTLVAENLLFDFTQGKMSQDRCIEELGLWGFTVDFRQAAPGGRFQTVDHETGETVFLNI